jgi:hypothetical protein
MDLLLQINNILSKSPEQEFVINKIGESYEVKVEDFGFIISKEDDVKFFKEEKDITENILRNSFYNWNGFYKWIDSVYKNKEFRKEFLTSFKQHIDKKG